MDFFKSVFSDEPDPEPKHEPSPLTQNSPDSDPNSPTQDPQPPQDPNPNPDPDSLSSWSFGGLIKTLTTRSESVIETCRRDLEEFGSGLKKETAVIREVASRAVKDLPGSLEVGASVAQESLETVGQAIDDLGITVWQSTAEIISHGKDALLSADQSPDAPEPSSLSSSAINSKRYSRFEAQVLAIQSDPDTYCDEPEDSEDFKKWQSGFVLEEQAEEIENLCGENDALEGIYLKLVPGTVDRETFWSRYFYRIHKLKVAEDARANLVKRVIAREDDEELSWEVEDDEEEEQETRDSKNRELEKKETVEVPEAADTEKKPIGDTAGPACSDQKLAMEGKEDGAVDESSSDDSVVKSDEKASSEGKTEAGESSKDSDFSVVSSQQSGHEEDDLGWDEIEDLGSIDEKKVTASSSPNKEDLRKRLSVADEEEDLSWDVEVDEPVKQ